MPITKNKICLLYCGGIDPQELEDWGDEPITEKNIKSWAKQAFGDNLLTRVDPVFIFDQGGSNITPDIWLRLTHEISKRIDQYQGFVVSHDIDNMINTANALAFMLQDLPKPVVVTGIPSQYSETKKPTKKYKPVFNYYQELGVRANVVNAIQLANMDIAEVSIIFGNRVMRASRTTGIRTKEFNFFDIFKTDYIGLVDFGITLNPEKVIKRQAERKLLLKNKIDEKVLSVELFPNQDKRVAEYILQSDWHGLAVLTYGEESFPKSFRPVLRRAEQKNLPIVNYSFSTLQKQLEKPYLMNITNMAWETAVIKLMWARGQTKSLKKIKEIMETDYVGEVSR